MQLHPGFTHAAEFDLVLKVGTLGQNVAAQRLTTTLRKHLVKSGGTFRRSGGDDDHQVDAGGVVFEELTVQRVQGAGVVGVVPEQDISVDGKQDAYTRTRLALLRA